MFTTTMLTAASHYSRANHVLLPAGDAACAKKVPTLSDAER